MIDWIITEWRKWRIRDRSHSSLIESYLVLLKSARRCAYDLDHAVSFIKSSNNGKDSWERLIMQPRAAHWLKIFSPTGVKDYKLQLHDEIDRLELKVSQLKRLLAENNIELPTYISDDEVPF